MPCCMTSTCGWADREVKRIRENVISQEKKVAKYKYDVNNIGHNDITIPWIEGLIQTWPI